MTIRFTITVPPDVARDPIRLVPYVQRLLPSSVPPSAMTLSAHLRSGLTIEFSLDYTTLDDARTGLAAFFANQGQIPDPPTP